VVGAEGGEGREGGEEVCEAAEGADEGVVGGVVGGVGDVVAAWRGREVRYGSWRGGLRASVMCWDLAGALWLGWYRKGF